MKIPKPFFFESFPTSESFKLSRIPLLESPSAHIWNSEGILFWDNGKCSCAFDKHSLFQPLTARDCGSR